MEHKKGSAYWKKVRDIVESDSGKRYHFQYLREIAHGTKESASVPILILNRAIGQVDRELARQ
jgi:hypothetical protein